MSFHRRLAVGLSLGILLAAPGSTDAARTPVRPRVVNGAETFDYPAVGLLLVYDSTALEDPAGFCSGTLVGCRTFLTAAHCVCPGDSLNHESCVRDGVADPSTLRVLFQNSGYLDVERVAVDPRYRFGESGDLALITLKEPVTAIAPFPIGLERSMTSGEAGVIVGFGNTMAGMRRDDAGIKRAGAVTAGACDQGIPEADNICWDFEGSGASTCEGDSGGPLFADLGNGPVLAGVTSGGGSTTCLAPDLSFDTDVFVEREWILATSGTDLGDAACGRFVPVGREPTAVLHHSGSLSDISTSDRWHVTVPAGTAEMRVMLSSVVNDGGPNTDFDLFIAPGPTADSMTFSCQDIDPSGFGACVVASPTPGTWTVAVERAQGDGAFQTSVTLLAERNFDCAGDCGGDSTTTVDELVTAVSIALGTQRLESCVAADLDQNGEVTIDELVSAVNALLLGCPANGA